MNRKAFGEAVANYRKLRGWTQEELAARCDLSSVYIRQLETGLKSPSADVLIVLSEQLMVSPHTLLKADLKTTDLDEKLKLAERFNNLSPKELIQANAMLDVQFGKQD